MQVWVGKLTNIKVLSDSNVSISEIFLKKFAQFEKYLQFCAAFSGKYSASGVIIISKQVNK